MNPVEDRDEPPLHPDPDLYPELADAGSLASALAREAQASGNSLDIRAPQHGRETLTCASIETSRGRFDVNIGAVERWFIASIWWRGVQLSSGNTDTISAIVGAASAWAAGVSLAELHAGWPYLSASALALAHERGPADAVAEKWRLLRAGYSSNDQFRVVGDIIEATYAVPALRHLFPYTSHHTLCFSTCTGFPYSTGIPRVEPRDGGGYVLRDGFMGSVIGEADDANDAVAMLLAHLPPGLGPATAGTADRE